jgi:hypothetical protein
MGGSSFIRALRLGPGGGAVTPWGAGDASRGFFGSFFQKRTERKGFFFEKKKQKTLEIWPGLSGEAGAIARLVPGPL